MIRIISDFAAIILVALLLLFLFAVVDSMVGAIWDTWTHRRERRVDRDHWFSREELDAVRAREIRRIVQIDPKDYIRDDPPASLWGRQISEGPPDQDAKVDAVRNEARRFQDRQVSRYLARKRW